MNALLGIAATLVAAVALTASSGGWRVIRTEDEQFGLTSLRTVRGSVLVVWAGSNPVGVRLRRNGAAPRVIAVPPTGGFRYGPVILLQQPRGRVLLYFEGDDATYVVSSADDGRTWAAPARTALPAEAALESATTRRDGTPVVAAIEDPSADPWRLRLYFGVNGQRGGPAFANAHATLAAPAPGELDVVYAVEGPGGGGTTYWERADAAGNRLGPPRRLWRGATGAALAVGPRGRLYAAHVSRGALRVAELRRGHVREAMVAPVPFFGALAPPLVGRRGRVTVVWLSGGRLFAARSTGTRLWFHERIHGDDLPYTDRAPVGGFTASPRRDGSIDAFASSGTRLFEERILFRRR